MIYRDAIDRLRFPENMSVGEDVYFWYSLIRNKKICYINESLALYRKNPSSLTKNVETYYRDSIKLFSRLIVEESDVMIKKTLQKHLADAYFELAYCYRKNFNRKESLRYVFKSIFLRPFTLKYYRILSNSKVG